MTPAKHQHRRRYGSADQGWVHRREVRIVSELLRGLAPRRCLDAPCGYGRWTPHLRDLGLERWVGVDRNPERLEAFRSQAPGVEADMLRALPFQSGSFDLVVSIRFLQHVRDAEARAQMLAELRRVCAGHLLISYYRDGGLHGLQRRLQRRARPLATLTPAGFTAEARAAGWVPLQERPLWRGVHAQTFALLQAGTR